MAPPPQPCWPTRWCRAAWPAWAAAPTPVELVRGLELAVAHLLPLLHASACPPHAGQIRAVAVIAANDTATGGVVADALERVGPQGVVTVEYGDAIETWLEVVDGMGFDRGYLSHHMVTDVEAMQVVLDDPHILMTDLKLQTPGGGRGPAVAAGRQYPPASDHRRRGRPRLRRGAAGRA